MAPIPSEPSMPIGVSPLTTDLTSVGGCRFLISALSPYFLNNPCSCAIHSVAKAAAGCEYEMSITPLGTGWAAADGLSGFVAALAAAAGFAEPALPAEAEGDARS